MKSPMLPAEHHEVVQRVLYLGRSGKPDGLAELLEFSKLPSNEIQRLSASAIGPSTRTPVIGFGRSSTTNRIPCLADSSIA